MFEKKDRGTLMMRAYKERVEKTFQAIEGNPGIEIQLLSGLLSLQLNVKPERIEEYIHTLADARKVAADMGRVWTTQAFENYQEAKRRQVDLQEEENVRKAKETGQVPLEAYETEGEK